MGNFEQPENKVENYPSVKHEVEITEKRIKELEIEKDVLENELENLKAYLKQIQGLEKQKEK